MSSFKKNNYFKNILFKILFKNSLNIKACNSNFTRNQLLNYHMIFDKSIKELMFSEHISYKTSKKYLRNLHTKEEWVVQGPGENAGIVDIGKSEDGIDYCIAIRIESHNLQHSYKPFEGAPQVLKKLYYFYNESCPIDIRF